MSVWETMLESTNSSTTNPIRNTENVRELKILGMQTLGCGSYEYCTFKLL